MDMETIELSDDFFSVYLRLTMPSKNGQNTHMIKTVWSWISKKCSKHASLNPDWGTTPHLPTPPSPKQKQKLTNKMTMRESKRNTNHPNTHNEYPTPPDNRRNQRESSKK